MELIFDSIEERDKFFKHYCPRRFGGKHVPADDCDPFKCRECWEQSGVKYRVKEKKQEYDNITITQRLYRIQSLYKSAKRLDPDFRPDDYVWIIGEALIDHLANTGYEYRSVGDKYKSLADICVTTCHDYALRVVLCKKNLEKCRPTPDNPVLSMFIMNARQQGKTEMYRQMMEELAKTKGDRHSDVDKLDALTYSYNYTQWRETLDTFMDKHDRIKKPQIKDVIFHDPATIVFWMDGTKTVVKVQDGDVFDPEKGLAMAICKKVLANADGEYWTENFKKWLPEEAYAKVFAEIIGRALHEGLMYGLRNEVKPTKNCEDCKNADVHEFLEPCKSCKDDSNFEAKDAKTPEKLCVNCKYHDKDASEDPCIECHPITRDRFEEKKEKKEMVCCCANCKYEQYPWNHDLCYTCGIHYANFKAADR